MVSFSRRTIASFMSLMTALSVQAVFLSCFAAANSFENVRLAPQAPRQGQTLEVELRLPPDATAPPVEFNKKTYKLFPIKKEGTAGDAYLYRTLVGVPADMPPGTYDLKVGDMDEKLTIKSGAFGVQHLHLPKDKDNFIASPGEEEAVHAAKATCSAEQLWDGPFKKPCAARMTTVFGLRRVVNGHLLKDYFHSGIDYAGALGSPVHATQRGKVILAHQGWRLHGNCVALDHGQGVISFYIHLNKIEVKPGQIVEAGQEIGKVGMSGRANGPHLHYSVYVNGDATNPADWFARTY